MLMKPSMFSASLRFDCLVVWSFFDGELKGVNFVLNQEEKYDVFKNTACMMHMGNLTKDFVPVGKEDQAVINNDTNQNKVAQLCGIDAEWMGNYFCKPKLKVGTEWVMKGSTCAQAAASVSGIARAIYERTFRFFSNIQFSTIIMNHDHIQDCCGQVQRNFVRSHDEEGHLHRRLGYRWL